MISPPPPVAVSVTPRDCPSPHGAANKCGRVLWGAVRLLLFRPTPAFFHGWRRLLLRCFGARIGRGAKIMPTVRIWAPWNLTLGDYATLSHRVDCYDVDRIAVGAHATVSQHAFLCGASHDIGDPHMGLLRAPIVIGPGAWVCAAALVHMGVTIGEGAVAGAGAVVVCDVEPWTVVAGNPARFVKRRELRSA